MTQRCTACQTPAFASRDDALAYADAVAQRLGRALVICTVLGLIPLVGLVPGVIYYRLNLISKVRAYVPRSTSFFVRWALRSWNMLLLCLQPVPMLGAATLPLMCWTNYAVYDRMFRAQVSAGFAARVVAPSAAAPAAAVQPAGEL